MYWVDGLEILVHFFLASMVQFGRNLTNFVKIFFYVKSSEFYQHFSYQPV